MSRARRVRLPPLPRVSDLLRMYGLSAQKQLSQNFIFDLNVTDKIAHIADVHGCHVCEVGSGPGSLTRSVLTNGAKHVAGVELDPRFMPSLEILSDAAKGLLKVYNADIMDFDIAGAMATAKPKQWHEEVPDIRIVGNLPFNVSIPLLLQWLEAVSKRRGPFILGRVPMSLVFQKEVADNIVATAPSYELSRLTIMVQHLCEVKKTYLLNKANFVPQPKVDAMLLHLEPLRKPKIDAPFEVVEQVVKALFSLRRKVIRQTLRCLFPEDASTKLVEELLEHSGLDPTNRPHQLTMEEYDALCQSFLHLVGKHDLSSLPLRVYRPRPVPLTENEVVSL